MFAKSTDTADLLDRNSYSYSVSGLAETYSGSNTFSQDIKYKNFYLDTDEVATVLMSGGKIPLRSKNR